MSAADEKPARASPTQRRASRLLVLLVLLAVVLWPAWHWWQMRQTHVYISDARIASDMVTMSAAESGTLMALLVRPGDTVKQGQVLARLDSRELDLKLEEADSELTRLDAERKRLKAEQRLIAARTESAVDVASASIQMMQADHRAALATLERTQSELTRAERLFRSKVISSQEVEDTRTAQEGAAERARQGEAGIAEARARLRAARVERERIAVIDAELEVLDANVRTLRARREQLAVRRADRELIAAFDAIIDQTFAEAGEHLREGARVLMLHDPTQIWIAANVKETELHRFAVGSTAEVGVDAFPDVKLTAKVEWVGPAANSQFALLPNPNPSGNFTKVTQRVPVRLDLDAAPSRLSPGMMVELSIDAAQH